MLESELYNERLNSKDEKQISVSLLDRIGRIDKQMANFKK